MAVIGIDLGTTNSLAACWRGGRLCLIPDENGEVLLPSVVSRTEEGTYIVGREAKELLHTRAESTVGSFKRFMGTEKTYALADKELTPVELSALVLQRIKANAEHFLKEEIEEAIITVPAYFNDRQRADTKKAAQIAGLNVERLINEPSAAALAYRQMICDEAESSVAVPVQEGKQESERKQEVFEGKETSEMFDTNLIVFDFGGGTLDLSYVECFDNIIEIVAVTGDNRLGGDDIDHLIAEYFCSENNIEISDLSINDYAALLKKSEQAKIALEQQSAVELSMWDKAVILDEDKLFQICISLFAKVKKLFLKLLKDADRRMSDIHALVMVGGSSRVKVFQRFLRELLGKEPVVMGDTDQVVAFGAGVYAGIRQRKEEIRDLLLTDVCPFSLGIETGEHGKMFPIIPRNTTLPAHRSEHFVTLHDYQRKIEVNVYQGEEYYVKDNLFLTKLETDVPVKRAGQEGIDVHFTYDINGILHVEIVNSQNERHQVLLANKTLTETQLAHYKKVMEAMELPPAMQPENQRILERLESLYQDSAGNRREYIGSLLGYFTYALNRGRQTEIRRAISEIEEILDSDMFSDEWQEEMRFNGALKMPLWNDCDSGDTEYSDMENDNTQYSCLNNDNTEYSDMENDNAQYSCLNNDNTEYSDLNNDNTEYSDSEEEDGLE